MEHLRFADSGWSAGCGVRGPPGEQILWVAMAEVLVVNGFGSVEVVG